MLSSLLTMDNLDTRNRIVADAVERRMKEYFSIIVFLGLLMIGLPDYGASGEEN